MTISRRHLLAGAAATAAVAAVPAVAIGAVEMAPAWSMTLPAWEPGTFYTVGSMVRIGNRLHRCMRAHIGGDIPDGEMVLFRFVGDLEDE